jgi:type IV secretory pathway VirB3-like protein
MCRCVSFFGVSVTMCYICMRCLRVTLCVEQMHVLAVCFCVHLIVHVCTFDGSDVIDASLTEQPHLFQRAADCIIC